MPTSVQITAPSSSLRLSKAGSKLLERKQHTSSLGRLGRTGIAKASTSGCEMNCWTAKSFTRCEKLKSSLKDGGTIATPNDHIVHWATAHLRQRPPFRWTKSQSCTNFQFESLKWGCSLVPNFMRTLVTKNIRKALNYINKIWLMGKSVVLHQENNIKC